MKPFPIRMIIIVALTLLSESELVFINVCDYQASFLENFVDMA